MPARIPSYLREAARLLSTELSELREFTRTVLSAIEAVESADREAVIRKYSRELAGRYHRAQGAAGFLSLTELAKFAKEIEDLFRSVQEAPSLEEAQFVYSLRGAVERLQVEVQKIEEDLSS